MRKTSESRACSAKRHAGLEANCNQRNKMEMDTIEKVTVVIPTLNRRDSVVRTIRTTLLNGYPDLELKIVDQSDDDRTEVFLQPLLTDPRITYIRTDTRGLSSALNVGIRC